MSFLMAVPAQSYAITGEAHRNFQKTLPAYVMRVEMLYRMTIGASLAIPFANEFAP
jgi:hypothetical protein